HDSAASLPQPECHPETRKAMVDNLSGWAVSDSSVKHQSATDEQSCPGGRIHWIYGPAGAGKCAIMQTLAQRFRDAGLLGSSLFSS
ncbi:hypothetical protein C8J57DRAFT_1003525, partial [Mycena rebaudengoi]